MFKISTFKMLVLNGLFLTLTILSGCSTGGNNKQDNSRSRDDNQKVEVTKDLQINTKTADSNNPSKEALEYNGPTFALNDVEGKEIKLTDYIGKKVILLDFWATWCPPCRKGIPDLIELQKKYPNDFIVIGISVDREKTIGDVPKFVKNQGINYPVVYFNQKVIEDFGGIEAIPTSFIINKKGETVKKTVGLESKESIEEILKSAGVKN